MHPKDPEDGNENELQSRIHNAPSEGVETKLSAPDIIHPDSSRDEAVSKGHDKDHPDTQEIPSVDEAGASHETDSHIFKKNSPEHPKRAPVTGTGKPDTTPEWPGKLFDIYRKLAKNQSKLFEVLTQLETERNEADSKLHNIDEALSKLEELFVQTNVGIYDEFKANHQSYKEQIKAVRGLERRTAKLFYKLAKSEPEFLQRIDAYFKRREDQQDDTSDITESGSEPSVVSWVAVLHPLEQQYYDKRGEVRSLREKLVNHTAELPVPASEDEPVSVFSNDDQYVQSEAFRKWWENRYHITEEELRIAEAQLTKLWNECQSSGLDVGKLDFDLLPGQDLFERSARLERRASAPTGFIAPFLPQDRNGRLPDFLQGLRWSKQLDQVVPLVKGLTNLSGKRNFVQEWVSNVHDGEPVETLQPARPYPTSEPERAGDIHLSSEPLYSDEPSNI